LRCALLATCDGARTWSRFDASGATVGVPVVKAPVDVAAAVWREEDFPPESASRGMRTPATTMTARIPPPTTSLRRFEAPAAASAVGCGVGSGSVCLGAGSAGFSAGAAGAARALPARIVSGPLGALAPMACLSASANSDGRAYRSSLDFATAFAITWSAAKPRSGRRSESFGGGSRRWAYIIATSESFSYVGAPVSASYAVQPNAYRSARWSVFGSPAACSGAM